MLIDEQLSIRACGQSKFAYGDLVLGLSRFSQLAQVPKMMLTSKVVKID